MAIAVIEPTETASDPDERLLRATLEGDLRAFGELIQRHEAAVRRLAMRVVGPNDADDVTQEAFLRAYHRLDRFRGEGQFRSWLLQIAANSALNAVRRRRPDPVDDIPESGRAAFGHDDDPGPVSLLEESERRERLQDKLGELRDEHRTVLILRDLEGLSYEEVAAATRTPVGSVKGRLHRARKELIEMMRANTYDWELPDER